MGHVLGLARLIRWCAVPLGFVAAMPAAVGSPPPQVAICAACHAPDGNSVVPDNPKLAGLDADVSEFENHDWPLARVDGWLHSIQC